MIVRMWRGRHVIGRCPLEECRLEISHPEVAGLKRLMRTHLRRVHKTSEEPEWNGP